MECPYCHNVMQKGIIYGDRYSLKWLPEEKDEGPVLSHFMKGIKLAAWGQGIVTYYCEKDGVFLIEEMGREDTASQRNMRTDDES